MIPDDEPRPAHGHLSIDRCMLARAETSRGEAADEKNYIYQHGISLSSAMIEDRTRIPSILIFNSALSHLLLASTTLESSLRQRLLEKAMKVYKLAYTIEQSSADYNNNNNIFKMSILNNLGVICRMLGKDEQAQEYFDYLVSMMMQLVQFGAHDNMLNHLNGIWANAVVKNVAPAA
ncbi:MAG: hypothetical protein SGBAC_008746 [Bacillariaceae sp.]